MLRVMIFDRDPDQLAATATAAGEAEGWTIDTYDTVSEAVTALSVSPPPDALITMFGRGMALLAGKGSNMPAIPLWNWSIETDTPRAIVSDHILAPAALGVPDGLRAVAQQDPEFHQNILIDPNSDTFGPEVVSWLTELTLATE